MGTKNECGLTLIDGVAYFISTDMLFLSLISIFYAVFSVADFQHIICMLYILKIKQERFLNS